MPVYEEKLISPLAVRYTQGHIRTTFRDGRPVEPTIEEIKAEPGCGDYDVILRAPFPHIEIIRWSLPASTKQRGERDESEASASGACDRADREHHWFTLDNRRLYCLQRCAVALLPKRCAAVVEILYADSGHVWRKYDSETQGCSVSISHSCKTAPIMQWSWQEQVYRPTTVAAAHRAFEARKAAELDDKKTTVDQLQDPPQEEEDPLSSIYDRLGAALLQAEEEERSASASSAAKQQKRPASGGEADCPTPSTTDAASEDESDGAREGGAVPSADATPRRQQAAAGAAAAADAEVAAEGAAAAPPAPEAAPREQDPRETKPESSPLAVLRRCLEGSGWHGRKGDSYELVFMGGVTWTCVRKDNFGSKKFTMRYDEEHHIVWWGTEKAYYFDATDVNDDTVDISWYAGTDWDKAKARFAWRASGRRWPVEGAAAQGLAAAAREASSGEALSPLAAEAVEEILWQVSDPKTKGRVWIDHWSSYYAPTLGPLRGFVEGLPERFAVTDLGGGKWSVALVPGTPRRQGEGESAAAARAIKVVKDQLRTLGGSGYVHIPSWDKEFLPQLGSLREFLKGRPDLFEVAPAQGGRPWVTLADTKADEVYDHYVESERWHGAKRGSYQRTWRVA